jgi:hemolysin III
LAFAGAAVLALRASASADSWLALGAGVFATTLVAVYAASTLSHLFVQPGWRHRFRILDQAVIYLLVVGTYTPFGLAYLRSGWWLAFLALLWALALAGFLSRLFFSHRLGATAVWTYVVLGWAPVVSAPALSALLPADVLWWMFAGGLCYTIGTLFLITSGRYRYLHAIWHMAVIAGSTCHYWAIYSLA